MQIKDFETKDRMGNVILKSVFFTNEKFTIHSDQQGFGIPPLSLHNQVSIILNYFLCWSIFSNF